MTKLRTIKEAHDEILKMDPQSCLKLYGLRQMVLSGKIPSVRCGKKYLLNMSTLLEELGGTNDQDRNT